MVKRLLNSLFSPHIKSGPSGSSHSSRLQLPEHPDTPIELVRSNRKKTIAFRVANNRIKITAPKRLALYRIQQLLHKRSEWIGKQLEYQASLPAVLPRQYSDGNPVRYLGRQYRLNITTATQRAPTVRLSAGQLMVALTESQQGQAEIQAALGKWYQQRAEQRLPEIVAQLSKNIDVDYGDIEIRHFKSRWGSCRADGRLQFNWRIMMAPSRVIEYVVTHELCHRIHLNHSPAFWSEVERHMPEFRQHRNWLKTNGHLLSL